jgi:hypothetical protein
MGHPGRDGDLPAETFRADRGGEVARQHLDRDPAPMLPVLREIHGPHATPPELALDGVAAGQGGRKLSEGICRRAPSDERG